MAETEVTVKFDNTAPDLSIDVDEGEYVNGEVEVDGSASDAEGLNATWFSIDGDVVSESLPYTIDTTDFDDGAYDLVWGARDVAGNEKELVRHLYFDNTPPELEIFIPEGPQRGLVPVYVEVSDNLALDWWGFLIDEDTPIMDGGFITMHPVAPCPFP